MGEDVLLCGNCRKKVSYKILRRRVTTVVHGVEIPYEESYGVCDECHKELYVPGLEDQNEILIEELYRYEKDLITVDELKAILKKRSMTPEELDGQLGLCKGTTFRYLYGHMPEKEVSDKIRAFGKG